MVFLFLTRFLSQTIFPFFEPALFYTGWVIFSILYVFILILFSGEVNLFYLKKFVSRKHFSFLGKSFILFDTGLEDRKLQYIFYFNFVSRDRKFFGVIISRGKGKFICHVFQEYQVICSYIWPPQRHQTPKRKKSPYDKIFSQSTFQDTRFFYKNQ